MNFLKILQLNTKSLKSNLDIVLKYIKDNKFDIAMLSETWPKKQSRIKDFNIFTKNRADGYGGVDIMVKKNLKLEE